jgi:hypothetical protein
VRDGDQDKEQDRAERERREGVESERRGSRRERESERRERRWLKKIDLRLFFFFFFLLYWGGAGTRCKKFYTRNPPLPARHRLEEIQPLFAKTLKSNKLG